MDELAKLYFKMYGKTYRVKVFPNTVWIERQPGGDNLPFERQQWPVWTPIGYDGTGIWDFFELSLMVEVYRRRCAEARH